MVGCRYIEVHEYQGLDLAKAKEYLQRSGLPPDKWKIKGVGTEVKTQAQEFWEASAGDSLLGGVCDRSSRPETRRAKASAGSRTSGAVVSFAGSPPEPPPPFDGNAGTQPGFKPRM